MRQAETSSRSKAPRRRERPETPSPLHFDLDAPFVAECVRAELLRLGDLALPELWLEYDCAARLSSHGPEAEAAEAYLRVFEKLGLRQRLADALSGLARPIAGRTLALTKATSFAEEGIELTEVAGKPGVRLAVWPSRLGSSDSLRRFMAHEQVRLKDFLDSSFAYNAALPVPGSSRMERELAHRRLRSLWGASIDGRLSARGQAPMRSREVWQAEAMRAFPRADRPAVEALIDRLYAGTRPSYPKILELCGSADLGVPRPGAPAPGDTCPLCHFVTFEWAPRQALQKAASRVAVDFPTWTEGAGACAHCIETYLPAGAGSPAAS